MSFIYRKAASMLSKCCQGKGIKEILYEKDDPSKKSYTTFCTKHWKI
ncbi:hypothetical protein PFMALIP_02895 [Plasmodium falciparum MaliPS096_E11]|uniref:Uncharacterized protein n=1 Tax=Plasmodium falciparum MaliPS096_E11 TaxID=1036727 RepID=A0A024WPF7_PLAFA|nr:hypothetical protein PFMALIP_02895 [Plasmodium falciparum MaliPS096_E11]